MQTVFDTPSLFRFNTMEMPQRREKRELTDLEKADCKTGKMIGGIAQFFCQAYYVFRTEAAIFFVHSQFVVKPD
jgi:hypothetical protein